jgi:hypothetical protein
MNGVELGDRAKFIAFKGFSTSIVPLWAHRRRRIAGVRGVGREGTRLGIGMV